MKQFIDFNVCSISPRFPDFSDPNRTDNTLCAGAYANGTEWGGFDANGTRLPCARGIDYSVHGASWSTGLYTTTVSPYVQSEEFSKMRLGNHENFPLPESTTE